MQQKLALADSTGNKFAERVSDRWGDHGEAGWETDGNKGGGQQSIICQNHALEQGSPTPSWNWATQQEVRGGQASETSSGSPHCSPWLTLLLEPPIPPALSPPPIPSMEKLSFTKPIPGTKKFGDRCSRTQVTPGHLYSYLWPRCP